MFGDTRLLVDGLALFFLQFQATKIAMKKSKQELTLETKVKITLVSAFLIFVYWVWPNSQPNEPIKRRSITQYEAKYLSEEIVKENLKSPSTASFSNLRETQITQVDNGYKVSGYVDSENGFGAMIRSNYTVVVIYLPETEEYEYHDLQIF